MHEFVFAAMHEFACVRGGRALALASPPLAARVQCRCAPRRELRAAAPKACHGRARRVRTTSAARSYRRAWASAFINRASVRRNHRGAKGWLPALLVLATIGKCSATEPFFPPPRSVEETSASLSRRTAPGRSRPMSRRIAVNIANCPELVVRETPTAATAT